MISIHTHVMKPVRDTNSSRPRRTPKRTNTQFQRARASSLPLSPSSLPSFFFSSWIFLPLSTIWTPGTGYYTCRRKTGFFILPARAVPWRLQFKPITPFLREGLCAFSCSRNWERQWVQRILSLPCSNMQSPQARKLKGSFTDLRLFTAVPHYPFLCKRLESLN